MDLGEALSAEAKRRPTEGGGKHPPEAKSFAKSSAEDLKRREMPPPHVTGYEVAEASTTPVFIYNVHQFTGLNLEPALVAELAGHPNVAGIKDSSGNIAQLSEIRRLTPPEFSVFVGPALVFLAALGPGANGGILAAANVLPEAFVRVKSLVQQGAWGDARALQWSLMEISKAVTVGYGIGGLKAAMEMRGYGGGEVRAPLTMPDERGMAKIRELLGHGWI